jgi:hypothetical protein
VESADDGSPRFSVSALVEMRPQRSNGTQPVVYVGSVEDAIFPLRLVRAAGLDEPAPREGGPECAVSRFCRAWTSAGSSGVGEACSVVDASDRAVIGDDPVAGGAIVVIGDRVQHAEQQARPRLNVGPLLVTAAEQVDRWQRPSWWTAGTRAPMAWPTSEARTSACASASEQTILRTAWVPLANVTRSTSRATAPQGNATRSATPEVSPSASSR